MKKKKKKANVNGDKESKRARVTVSKLFCNCVGDLVVRRINKFASLLIFLLLWYKHALDVLR